MKKVMFALLALMFSVAVVNATTVSTSKDVKTTKTKVVDDKVKIKAEELPDAVKMALNSPDYTGWQINAAYKYNDKEIYEVELKNGTEVKTVKFDKDGKEVS